MQAHHMTLEQMQGWLDQAQILTKQRTPATPQSPTEQMKSLTLDLGIVTSENAERGRCKKAFYVWQALHISLLLANAMNIRLSDRWQGMALRKDGVAASSPEQFQSVLVQTVGAMAKAMEATDHFENFPSRQVMEDRTFGLAVACFTRARRLRMTMDLG